MGKFWAVARDTKSRTSLEDENRISNCRIKSPPVLYKNQKIVYNGENSMLLAPMANIIAGICENSIDDLDD
jgi:hypothetical protein